jgi:lysophospholipase L1-like esterase
MKTFFLALSLLLVLPAASPVAAEPPPHSQWEPEIHKFEVNDRQSPPRRGGVLFLGSSSIRLWTSLATDFPGLNVLNRGFGDSAIADSTYFAGRIVIPYRPRLIVFYAGDNDLANGRTPRNVLMDFAAFVKRVRKDLPNVRIAFISIKPSPARKALFAKAKSANRLVQDYAGQKEGLLYIDVFTPMLTPEGEVRGDLFVEDGLHLNAAGYGLWKQVIAPYLIK